MKRLTANVTGLVQGVSFRYYARREANRLGVKGWVRNESNGSVQLVAEGDEEALRTLLRFLHQGPSMARVDEVAASWTDSSGEFSTFEVRFA
jgi:acylphosphatase